MHLTRVAVWVLPMGPCACDWGRLRMRAGSVWATLGFLCHRAGFDGRAHSGHGAVGTYGALLGSLGQRPSVGAPGAARRLRHVQQRVIHKSAFLCQWDW